MWPTALVPLETKSCNGFLSPLQIHCPPLRSNPWTLVPMASTMTSWPRRSTVVEVRGTRSGTVLVGGVCLASLYDLCVPVESLMCRPEIKKRKSHNFTDYGGEEKIFLPFTEYEWRTSVLEGQSFYLLSCHCTSLCKLINERGKSLSWEYLCTSTRK
jgi:hypothetical protein